MSLIYKLGITSADAIQVYPKHTYTAETKHIRSESRTRAGKRFEYKWGSYGQWGVSVEFVPNAQRTIIESWWDSRAALLLFITSDTATEVHSVMIMNDSSPLNMFVKPYDDEWQGKLNLETY